MSAGVRPFPGSGNPNFTSGQFNSAGDNPFAAFFGPNAGVNVDNKDRYPHETFNLPKAYEGKNIHLERQIWWMLNQAEFFVEKLCPWEQTEQLHVKWDIWKFNHTLADLEPEQGVPRFVTQERESRSDSLVRRGLAFMIEHGFYKTAEGQEHYLMNLRQIVDAVHTTVYYGVLSALLNAKNHYKEEALKKGYTHTQMEDVMRQERERWAIAQKTERGMYVLDARLKDDMAREQVVPDVWVFPPRMAIYLTMIPSAEVEYYRKGPGAAENLEKGGKNMLTFRGSTVHEAQAIDVDFAGEPRDMLTRDRMIGSYYTMYDHIPRRAVADYRSDMRSVHIYDMNADKFKKITLTQALNNCDFDDWVKWCQLGPIGVNGIPSLKELYDALRADIAKRASREKEADDGETACEVFCKRSGMTPKFLLAWLNDDIGFSPTPVVGGSTSDAGKTMEALLAEITAQKTRISDMETAIRQLIIDVDKARTTKAKEAKAALAAKAAEEKEAAADVLGALEVELVAKNKAYITSGATMSAGRRGGASFDKQFMLQCVSDNVRIPVAFILARPFQRYECSSAILAKGGKDLGITYHGHHDFMLTDDVVHKTHMGHYTFYSKTVIRNPNHFAIAEDVFCTGYRGGEGCEFFDQLHSDAEGKTTISDAVESGDPKHKSIFCMVISGERASPQNREHVLNPISITGRHAKEDVRHDSLASTPTYPSADFYFEFYQMRFWDLGTEDPSRFQQEYEKVNRCCFQGRQQIFNWEKKDFSNEIQETGHWGLNGTYEGCRAARTGRDVFLCRPKFEPAFL